MTAAAVVRRVGRPARVEQVAPWRTDAERRDAIRAYYRAGRACAGQAVIYYAIVGYELAAVRGSVGHGNWEDWVKANCPFSLDTAQRYLALAKNITERTPNTARVRFLIDMAPSAMTDEQIDALAAIVEPVVKEHTLRQLYLDFKIIKEPAAVKIGGDTSMYRKSASEADEAKKALYRDLWKKTAKQIRAMGESWRFLEEADRREIGETFWALGRQMRGE